MLPQMSWYQMNGLKQNGLKQNGLNCLYIIKIS